MYSIYKIITKSRTIIINKYDITTLFVIVTMHSFIALLLQKIIHLLYCCKTSLQGHSGFLRGLWFLPICSGGDDGWETRQPYPGTGLARPVRAHSSWKAFSMVCGVLWKVMERICWRELVDLSPVYCDNCIYSVSIYIVSCWLSVAWDTPYCLCFSYGTDNLCLLQKGEEAA